MSPVESSVPQEHHSAAAVHQIRCPQPRFEPTRVLSVSYPGQRINRCRNKNQGDWLIAVAVGAGVGIGLAVLVVAAAVAVAVVVVVVVVVVLVVVVVVVVVVAVVVVVVVVAVAVAVAVAVVVVVVVVVEVSSKSRSNRLDPEVGGLSDIHAKLINFANHKPPCSQLSSWWGVLVVMMAIAMRFSSLDFRAVCWEGAACSTNTSARQSPSICRRLCLLFCSAGWSLFTAYLEPRLRGYRFVSWASA